MKHWLLASGCAHARGHCGLQQLRGQRIPPRQLAHRHHACLLLKGMCQHWLLRFGECRHAGPPRPRGLRIPRASSLITTTPASI